MKQQGLLPRGQTVAAQVPYTKRKQEWIIASVISWNEETNSYPFSIPAKKTTNLSINLLSIHLLFLNINYLCSEG